MKGLVVLGVLVVFLMLFVFYPSSVDDSEVTPVCAPVWTPVPTPTPLPTRTPVPVYPLEDIRLDLEMLRDRGWNGLYVPGRFDCSRMSVFLWDYLRQKYKIPPKIFLSNELHHAWVGLRVSDAGGKIGEYPTWTIKGVEYYYIESTIPMIVGYEDAEKYNVSRVIVCDWPGDASDYAGRWSTEFRLTKEDLDLIRLVVEGYEWR